MLRGKTIEEIVNKWTSELETNVKEFNGLAGEIAVWDRALIDNGNTASRIITCPTEVIDAFRRLPPYFSTSQWLKGNSRTLSNL